MPDSADKPAPRRIYLDNAATAWPKLPEAVAAAEHFTRHWGASAGRGTYRSAQVADGWLTDARRELAQLIGAASAQDIALCTSGTHALNAGLLGLIRPGEHVITTASEHNSLLRPLKYLETYANVRLSIVDCDRSGWSDPRAAQSLVSHDTRWLAIGHASNVTGQVQDLRGWGALARSAGARLMVDASQTLGYLPIDVTTTGIDVLAAAGHKGLRALAGTGLLMVERSLQSQLRPLMFGGTGLASEQLSDGQPWPQSVEVGNLNLPGVVSLAVAAQHLNRCLREDAAVAYEAWKQPLLQLVLGLQALPGLRLIGWEAMHPQTLDNTGSATAEATASGVDLGNCIPVVSLQVAGWDVHDLANILDSSFGIEVRAGWHCAALVHAPLGTASQGGTLRLSPGVSTTSQDIATTLAALAEILV